MIQTKEQDHYWVFTHRMMVVGAVSIIVLLYVLDLNYLFIQPIGVGVDAYYYAIQVNSVSEGKGLYFPTYSPLVAYFLATLKVFVQDALLAIKLGALILNLLLAAGVFFLVRIGTNNRRLGIGAVLLLEASSLHLYPLIEYVNNLGAIAFIVFGFLFFIHGLSCKKSLWLVFSLCCFLAAIGSHRSALPIILSVVVCAVLVYLFPVSAGKHPRKLGTVAVAAAVALFFSPALLAAQPFFSLPVGLGNEFNVFPWIPARLANLPETLMLLLLAPLTLVAIFRWNKGESNRVGQIIFGTVALWSILISLNPFISSNLGFLSLGGRLRVLEYIQVAILFPGVVWLLYDSHKRLVLVGAGYVGLLMVWSCFFNPLPRGAQPEYLAQREKLIEALKIRGPQINPNSLILAEHGEQFVVTAITGIPSQQHYPQDRKYDEVYWLLNRIPPTLVDQSMVPILRDDSGLTTLLVKDDESWRRRIQNPQIRGQFFKHNPHLRSFMSKYQRDE